MRRYDRAHWVPAFDELLIDFLKGGIASCEWLKRDVEFNKQLGARRHDIQLEKKLRNRRKPKESDAKKDATSQYSAFKQLGLEIQSAAPHASRRRE